MGVTETVGLQFTGCLYGQKKDGLQSISYLKEPKGKKKTFTVGALDVELTVDGDPAWMSRREAEMFMRQINENYKVQKNLGKLEPGAKPTLVVVKPTMEVKQEHPALPTYEEWDGLKFQDKKSKLSELTKNYEGLNASAFGGNLKEDELNNVFDMFVGKIQNGRATYREKIL